MTTRTASTFKAKDRVTVTGDFDGKLNGIDGTIYRATRRGFFIVLLDNRDGVEIHKSNLARATSKAPPRVEPYVH